MPRRPTALNDGSDVLELAHLQEAEALWRYAEDSGVHIYGETVADDVADRLLAALHLVGEEGLDGRDLQAIFGRYVPAPRLALARQSLEERGLAVTHTVQKGGRPRTVTVATANRATRSNDVPSGPREVLTPLRREGRP